MAGVVSSTVMAGGTILGGILQADAARDAASTAADAQRYAADLTQSQFEQTRADQQPYRDVATGTRGYYDDLVKQRQALVDEFRFKERDEMARLGVSDWTDDQILQALSSGDMGSGWNSRWNEQMMNLRGINREIESLGDPANLTEGALNTLAGYGRSRVDPNAYIPDSQVPVYDSNLDLTKDPSYLWRMNEQNRNINANMAGMGKMMSGNRLEEIMKRSGEMASQEYAAADARNRADYGIERSNEATTYGRGVDAYGRAYAQEGDYLNRLASLSNIGQTATNNMGRFGAASAANQAAAYTNAANAQAAGRLGQTSALTNTIGDLSSLYGNYLSYNQQPRVTTDYSIPMTSWSAP